MTTYINDLLREYVTLTVECLDRIYLNGYIPTLQTPGQLINFLIRHRGHKIPSPVLLGRITQAFARAVKSFAQKNSIPLIHFERGQRKDDVAAEYRKEFNQSEGVVFIGVAQEKANAFRARKKKQKGYVSEDSIYRVKSNALYGLALSGPEAPFGYASFSGNYEFVVYAEDRDGLGTGTDRFWIEVRDGTTLGSPAEGKAVEIQGGSIVVPH